MVTTTRKKRYKRDHKFNCLIDPITYEYLSAKNFRILKNSRKYNKNLCSGLTKKKQLLSQLTKYKNRVSKNKQCIRLNNYIIPYCNESNNKYIYYAHA